LPDHSNYSKRALAQDLIEVMDTLGIAAFALCGHDRGGRVAHRLALDHPARVRRLCVIDIAPTLDMYARTDFDFARAYYHWFHLIQPRRCPS
jgi:haloacetate dehalogenase